MVKINAVLSLFDGISCGQVALGRAEIPYMSYYASEIDKYAIQVTQCNHPNTIQLGDVRSIGSASLPAINLLLGGSPCQSFSTAGNNTGFNGKSGLFYEYVRLLKECNPEYFLFENVRMKKEWQDIISLELGVEPVKINSNLFSAQNRERFYWTNIPIAPIVDKKIYIEDVLETSPNDKYWLKDANVNLLLKKISLKNAPDLACIDVYNRKIKQDRKSPTLSLPNHNSIRVLQYGRIRKLTPQECEKLQTLPNFYTDCGISDTQRYTTIGNGWTVDAIAHILRGIIY